MSLALGFLIGERLAHSQPVSAAGLTAMRQQVEDDFELATKAISASDQSGKRVSDEAIEQLGLQVAMDTMAESLRRDEGGLIGYGSVAEQADQARQIGSAPAPDRATLSTITPSRAISMKTRPDSEGEDYYDTFAGRGQELQDQFDLEAGWLPSERQPRKNEPAPTPASTSISPAWPFPQSALTPVLVEKQFIVMCDDNFHSGDMDTDTYALDRYATFEEALARCRSEVDRHLHSIHEPDITAAKLWDLYTDFGPDPWIRGPGLPQVPFSAWDYAKARAVDICGSAAKSVITPESTPSAASNTTGTANHTIKEERP